MTEHCPFHGRPQFPTGTVSVNVLENNLSALDFWRISRGIWRSKIIRPKSRTKATSQLEDYDCFNAVTDEYCKLALCIRHRHIGSAMGHLLFSRTSIAAKLQTNSVCTFEKLVRIVCDTLLTRSVQSCPVVLPPKQVSTFIR